RNGLAHQAFGIVHHGSAGGLKRLKAVLAHQRLDALRPDTRRGDLRLHIANDQVGDADIVAQKLPYRLDLVAAVVDLDGLELQPFSIGVERVDDATAARTEGADVQMVRCGAGESNELAVVEQRYDEGDIRTVARTRVGIVVHNDVARCERLTARFEEA